MRTISLTNEQAEFLEGLLEREMDEEFLYQVDGNKDTQYYADLLALYKKVQGKPMNFIEAFAISDIVGQYEKQLEELRK